jgi:hypothetical protein
MRSRLMLAVVLLSSIPAFSQFNLALTGGSVKFGAAPLNITVVANGGTTGNVTSGTPCGANQAATLTGTARFVILGTMTEFGRHWNVEFVMSPPGFANQGNLSNSGTNWEITGKYTMTISEIGTSVACRKVVGASGEYQFAGPKLAGWPAKCPKPTNAPGQSPGLPGALILRGHANIHPVFTASPTCPATLAGQWNAKIAGKGFDAVNLDYKLTY